jgi:hypothetical protein
MVILRVLYAIDGNATIHDISQKLHIDLESLKKIIQYLHRLGLIEFVQKTSNASIIEFLCNEFTNIVGPVADLIVDELIEDMGYTRASFPKDKIFDLVQNVSLECDDGPEKNTFIQRMLTKLR